MRASSCLVALRFDTTYSSHPCMWSRLTRGSVEKSMLIFAHEEVHSHRGKTWDQPSLYFLLWNVPVQVRLAFVI
jgi:hypothetical protein